MNFDLRVSFRSVFLALLIGVVALSSASCGGGQGGGPAPDGPGQGLVLISFLQSGLDNVALNTRLEFRFSEPLMPSTITTASVQIREGSSFGLPIQGDLRVEGAKLHFDPELPSLCDFSTSAFKPGTSYRISLIGYPEEFAITNTNGQPLAQTLTYEFTTRPEGASELFIDQIPGQLPKVLSASPASSEAAVTVLPGNAVVLEMSENLDPCTVDYSTVRFTMYETGDSTEFVNGAPSGNASGFVPWEDQAPTDPYTWGANGTNVVPPQVIPFTVRLEQDFESTRLRLESNFGVFPENALLVVELLGGITDFGGYPLEPFVTSFTTENLPEREDAYVLENEGETPYLEGLSTADVNTSRSPSRVQGFVLISGDGDNGTQLVEPSSPHVPPDCTALRDTNDGIADEYEPAGPNALLDTGSTINTCPNSVDGSNAVVWEFKSFKINPGVTVDIVGVNPALILVNGPIVIAAGGTLNLAGANAKNGASGIIGTRPLRVSGAKGVAGGGDGGRSLDSHEDYTGTYPVSIPYVDNFNSYGKDGEEGYGSPAYGTSGQHGGGQGNAGSWFGALPPPTGPYYEGGSYGGGGGGGGHASTGGTGGASEAPAGNSPFSAPARGFGGQPYDDLEMSQPTAGSGGGAGGYFAFPSYPITSQLWGAAATAGGGGAGGGFVDLTSSFDISIHGTIDASGGRGGSGGATVFCDPPGAGGSGGGSGGGVRILTSASIDVSGATITTAGGLGGSAGGSPTCATGTVGNPNAGGFGSAGRLVLEDADGVIAGQGTATLVPTEGQEGFYRNKFDSRRFVGGGRRTVAVSDLFLVGAFDPLFIDPPEGPSGDFIAGIPSDAAAAPGVPQIVLEARGFQMMADGTADDGSDTGWRTVGYFTNSGSPTEPVWHLGQVSGDVRPPDNTQSWGITNLNTCEYVQIRVTLQLGLLASIEDFGPYLDRWNIRFLSDR